MKTFAKRAAIVCGILMAAMLCMGIVYIDNLQTYWRISSTFAQLVVSNSISTITINTNWPQGFGFNTNNTARSFVVQGFQPPTNASGVGASAATVGAVVIKAGTGGTTSQEADSQGGAGGITTIAGGDGGVNPNSTNNAAGNNGGALNLSSGSGGAGSTVATNSSTGGGGGAVSISSGSGGSPAGVAPTNGVGGNAGNFNISGGSGGSPSVGWARKGGNGGGFNLVGGAGGTGVRTNGGNGGSANITAGQAGSSSTGGNAGAAGNINLIAGAGSAGGAPGTNSNGGHVYVAGGAPGSGAQPGDVYLAREAGGSRGGVIIGISNSAALTNVIFARVSADFGNIAAQTSEDIPVVTVAGRTNAVVSVGAPASAMSASCMFSGWMSNGVVFVRFNNYSAGAIDPGISDFEVEIKAYR